MYTALCGRTLALADARARGRQSIAGYLGDDATFDEAGRFCSRRAMRTSSKATSTLTRRRSPRVGSPPFRESDSNAAHVPARRGERVRSAGGTRLASYARRNVRTACASSAGEDVTGHSGVLAVTAPPRWQPSLFGVVPAGKRPPPAERRRPTDPGTVVGRRVLRRDEQLRRPTRRSVHRPHQPSGLDRRRQHVAVPDLQRRGGDRHRRRAVDQPQLRRWRSRSWWSARSPPSVAWAVADLIDVDAVRQAAGSNTGSLSAGSIVWLAVTTAVLLTAAPYLVRPARRIVPSVLTPRRGRCRLRRGRSDPVDPGRARHRLGDLGGDQPGARHPAGDAVAIDPLSPPSSSSGS